MDNGKCIYTILRKDNEIKHVEKGTQKKLINWLIIQSDWVVIGEVEVSGDIGLGQLLQLHDLRLKARIDELEGVLKHIRDSIPCL